WRSGRSELRGGNLHLFWINIHARHDEWFESVCLYWCGIGHFDHLSSELSCRTFSTEIIANGRDFNVFYLQYFNVATSARKIIIGTRHDELDDGTIILCLFDRTLAVVRRDIDWFRDYLSLSAGIKLVTARRSDSLFSRC